MRKFILSFVAALLLTTTLSAQVSFGVRAGLNASNASIDVSDSEIDVDGSTDLMLGLFFDFPIAGPLSIQPEATYLNRGYSADFGLGELGSVERDLAFFDLGAIARLNFNRDEALGFYVGAGPTFSYAVSGTTVTVAGEEDTDFDAERIKRSGFQFSALAGLTFDIGPKLFVEARYNGSLSDQSDVDDVEIRQNSVGINGGIMIPFGN